MTNNKPRVLILVADVGYGHRSASKAIVTAFEEQYGTEYDVVVANPFDEPTVPAVIRQAQSDHTRLVRELPQVYTLGLRVTDSELTKGIGSVAGMLMLNDAVADVVDRHQPAVVIITHPISTEPVLSYRKTYRARFPVVTLITDLTRLHRLWFNENVDVCVVPTRAAVGLAIERGMPAERVMVTGIPIDPRFAAQPKTKAEYRQEMGLDPERFTMLVVGSKRVADLDEFLAELNRSDLPLQLVAVAGGDDELFGVMNRMVWQIPVAHYNFVENMPDMMQAADCILTKAGGLIVSESLACGLPMLIMQCNPLHEKGNAEFVVLQGAGEMAAEPADIVPVLRRWLDNDQALFVERSAYARRLGRPRAAYEVANIVYQLARGQKTSSDVFTPYRRMD